MANMISPPSQAERHQQAQSPEPSFTACHKTLETVELLEQILSHLPMKNLLFAQKISRTWQNCIKNSKRLQQGLFFRAPGAQPTVDLVGQLLNDVLPGDLKGSNACKERYLQSAVINPLLRNAFSPKQMTTHLLGSDGALSCETAFARPEASWRNILLTHPELKRIDAESLALRSNEAFVTFLGPSRPPVTSRALKMGEVRIRVWVENLFITTCLAMKEPKTTAELEALYLAASQA